jgi:hypothetical protein
VLCVRARCGCLWLAERHPQQTRVVQSGIKHQSGVGPGAVRNVRGSRTCHDPMLAHARLTMLVQVV